MLILWWICSHICKLLLIIQLLIHSWHKWPLVRNCLIRVHHHHSLLGWLLHWQCLLHLVVRMTSKASWKSVGRWRHSYLSRIVKISILKWYLLIIWLTLRFFVWFIVVIWSVRIVWHGTGPFTTFRTSFRGITILWLESPFNICKILFLKQGHPFLLNLGIWYGRDIPFNLLRKL